MNQSLSFAQLVSLCTDTHREMVTSAARAVDTRLVVRNFLIGHYIVHYEQDGSDRAEYGKQTLKLLSQSLNAVAGRGFSVDNLELMRRSYPHFSGEILCSPISETPSRISAESRLSGLIPRELTLSEELKEQLETITIELMESGG